MLRVYKMLLWLYPREYRRQFAGEMLAVFTEAAKEQHSQGRLRYARFLVNEYAGLLSGVCGETARARMSLAPAVGGFVLAALWHAAFFAFVSVARGAAYFARRYTLSPADPLADSVTLCFLAWPASCRCCPSLFC